MVPKFLKLLFRFCIGFAPCFFPQSLHSQINPEASEKTKMLYNNLKIIQQSNTFLFGQEFFNSFRHSSGSAHGEKEYSDSKAVTGSHPAVLGSDFHYYLEKSEQERGYHTEAVKWAYQQGYAITFDWHISGKGTTTYEYKAETKDLVNNIVNDLNGDRAWLYEQFDKVISIINNDLVVEGEKIPIVFRPWHEMNGGWFWWGSQATTAANYKKLYQITVDYFKTRTTTVLFCWSPNTPTNLNYYPGDDYVDVLGLDIYELTADGLQANLTPIIDYALGHNKVAVLSETGNRTSNGDNAASYWSGTVLPAIVDDPAGKLKRIAWVLTWINASWSFAYVPHSTSTTAAKESFINFRNSPFVLFGDEIESLYSPMDLPVAVSPALDETGDLDVYPVPASGKITVHLKHFQFPVKLTFYNQQGQQLSEITVHSETVTLDSLANTAGLYLVKATDNKRNLSKRIIFE